MHTLSDKRTHWPTLFREWFCNSEANRHEICTRLRQRVKNNVSRISSESVNSHSMKLTMMFKLDLKKMTLTTFKTTVQNGLMQKVKIFCTENKHLHAFYAPTKNRTNWMRASCHFLCLKKIGHYFWRRVYIVLAGSRDFVIDYDRVDDISVCKADVICPRVPGSKNKVEIMLWILWRKSPACHLVANAGTTSLVLYPYHQIRSLLENQVSVDLGWQN